MNKTMDFKQEIILFFYEKRVIKRMKLFFFPRQKSNVGVQWKRIERECK